MLVQEGMVLLALVAAAGVRELVRRRIWTQRSFDRGGLRIRRWLTGARAYLPFSSIATVDVERGNALVLRDRHGSVRERVWFFSPEACGRALAALPRFTGRPQGVCAALARGGLDLEGWLGRVRALTTERGPYRGSDVDAQEAHAVACNEAAPITERAAALHFLCCAGQQPVELLASLDRQSPPLMVVVAALAPGCEALVPLAQDLVRYLPDEDQAAFRRAREPSRHRTHETATTRTPRTA